MFRTPIFLQYITIYNNDVLFFIILLKLYTLHTNLHYF